MSRNVVVAILGLLVFLVVAGAVYLEIAASSGATDTVWVVTRAVSAGDLLSSDNVRRVRIRHATDGLDYFTGQVKQGTSRASHGMSAGTLLFSNDVMDEELALVNLSLRTPPQLAHGQHVDVYAQVGSQTMMLGRGLMVDQVSGTSCSVWVPASDEPSWITLQASNVAMFAARSTGIGVPQTRPQSLQDALATLSGGSATGPPVAPPTTPTPAPTPTKKP
jgi:hypothetical protein